MSGGEDVQKNLDHAIASGGAKSPDITRISERKISRDFRGGVSN
jgi:hypothetical protein